MAGITKNQSVSITATAESYIDSAGGQPLLAALTALGEAVRAAQMRAWEVRLVAETGISRPAAVRHVATAVAGISGLARPDTGWGGKRR